MGVFSSGRLARFFLFFVGDSLVKVVEAPQGLHVRYGEVAAANSLYLAAWVLDFGGETNKRKQGHFYWWCCPSPDIMFDIINRQC